MNESQLGAGDVVKVVNHHDWTGEICRIIWIKYGFTVYATLSSLGIGRLRPGLPLFLPLYCLQKHEFLTAVQCAHESGQAL
jgi:hypothetical protein